MKIKVKFKPLKETTLFLDLGRTTMYNNSEWVALYINLQKSQRIWGMVEKVLVQTGGNIKARAMMYNMVVQLVILYGREIWAMTDAMMTVLEGFHHRIAGQIAGISVRKVEWEWALVDEAFDTMCIWLIREYIRRWQVKTG